jgi:sugar phosphate permease
VAVQHQDSVGFTAAEEKSANKKLLIRILPFISLLYMLSYLDRVNIGFAKASLEADLGIGAAAYGLGAGIFFVGYVIFEIPSNLILHRVGPRRWLSRIMVTWGLVAAGMAFIQGPTSFYVMRFILGFAEAGLFPGVVMYLTYWYSNKGRSTAIGLSVYWGLAISFILGGPLSELLLSMDGIATFQGWQWMFGVQGGLTVIVGIVTWFYLTDRPSDATWLTPGERESIEAKVREEDQTRLHVPVLKALSNRKVLYLGSIFFCINLSLYGLTFWLPTIVGDIEGLSSTQKGLLVGMPWVFGLISVFLVTRAADRTGKHAKVAAFSLATLALGLALSTTVGPVLGMVFICLAVCGLLGALPTFWNLPTNYLSGAAAAAGIALINTIGSLSGFTAPYLFGLIEDATGSIKLGLYTLAAMALVGSTLLLRYRKPPVTTAEAALEPSPATAATTTTTAGA